MKTILNLTLLLFSQILIYSQENNIIIRQTTINNDSVSIEFLNKENLSKDLDSLDFVFMNEVKENLKSKQNTEFIKKLLIGNWFFQSSKTLSGIDVEGFDISQIIFNENGEYIEIIDKKKRKGKWEILEDHYSGNLKLTMKSSKLPKESKKLLIKTLGKEKFREMNFKENYRIIQNVDSENLQFIFLLPNEKSTTYKVVFIKYNKENASS